MKKYGKELAESIKQTLQRTLENIEERQRHIDDCMYDWDDCFVSDHLDHDKVRECEMQLEILKGDGLMDYTVIVDQEGKEVAIHSFINKWGRLSYVARDIFASSIKALLKKTGWREEVIRVPAWTKFISNGSGIAGACSGSTGIVRWHTNMVTGEYVGYPD